MSRLLLSEGGVYMKGRGLVVGMKGRDCWVVGLKTQITCCKDKITVAFAHTDLPLKAPFIIDLKNTAVGGRCCSALA